MDSRSSWVATVALRRRPTFANIAHEYEELRAGGKHADALKAAAKTDLPISEEARRLNRARAR